MYFSEGWYMQSWISMLLVTFLLSANREKKKRKRDTVNSVSCNSFLPTAITLCHFFRPFIIAHHLVCLPRLDKLDPITKNNGSSSTRILLENLVTFQISRKRWGVSYTNFWETFRFLLFFLYRCILEMAEIFLFLFPFYLFCNYFFSFLLLVLLNKKIK